MNKKTVKEAIIIDQAQLTKIKFSENEVLNNPLKKQERRHQMIVASTIKSLGRDKVTITFKSLQRGLLKVVASIESAGKEFLVLKGGAIIPIKSIVKINS